MDNIIVGTKTFVPFTIPTSSTEQAVWRVEDPAVPALYRPTIKQSAIPNASKTNVNETVTVEVPVVRSIDGVFSAPNKFIASAKYTALQAIVNPVEAALALDALIKALQDRRDLILAGKTN